MCRPNDDKSAIIEYACTGAISQSTVALATRGCRVDLETVPEAACGGIEQPSKYAVPGAIVAAGVIPGDHDLAARIGGNGRDVLMSTLRTAGAYRRADQGLAADQGAVVGVALEVNVVAA